MSAVNPVYYIGYPLADVIPCEICLSERVIRVNKQQQKGVFIASSRRQNYKKHLIMLHNVPAENIKIRCSICGRVSNKPSRTAWQDTQSHYRRVHVTEINLELQRRMQAQLPSAPHHVALGYPPIRQGDEKEAESYRQENEHSSFLEPINLALPKTIATENTVFQPVLLSPITNRTNLVVFGRRNVDSPGIVQGNLPSQKLLKTQDDVALSSYSPRREEEEEAETGRQENEQSSLLEHVAKPIIVLEEIFHETVVLQDNLPSQVVLKTQEQKRCQSNKSTIISAMGQLLDVVVETEKDQQAPATHSTPKTKVIEKTLKNVLPNDADRQQIKRVCYKRSLPSPSYRRPSKKFRMSLDF